MQRTARTGIVPGEPGPGFGDAQLRRAVEDIKKRPLPSQVPEYPETSRFPRTRVVLIALAVIGAVVIVAFGSLRLSGAQVVTGQVTVVPVAPAGPETLSANAVTSPSSQQR